jgi:hypothetical protein
MKIDTKELPSLLLVVNSVLFLTPFKVERDCVTTTLVKNNNSPIYKSSRHLLSLEYPLTFLVNPSPRIKRPSDC